MATAVPNSTAWPPALCTALEPVDAIRGQKNVNHVWMGDVLVLEGQDEGAVQRCVFKLLDPATTLPIELACALTAHVLGNDVPAPCLVQAEAAQLPGCPPHLHGQALLLFGSTYLAQDHFFEQLATQGNEAALEAAVWQHYCGNTRKAAKGAVLDELISNVDRHMRNLRFDGSRWWLLDHDLSLLETHHQDPHAMAATFSGHHNLIATELLSRRQHDHAMDVAARRSSGRQKKLLMLAAGACRWQHALPEVQAIYQRTAALLQLLGRRLPMLQQMVNARIGRQDPSTLPWNSSTTPPARRRLP